MDDFVLRLLQSLETYVLSCQLCLIPVAGMFASVYGESPISQVKSTIFLVPLCGFAPCWLETKSSAIASLSLIE
jgi:hypothetical protein